MMEKMLTEIGSYSLFHEYLNVVGVASPGPDQNPMGVQKKRSSGGPNQGRPTRQCPLLHRCQSHIGQLTLSPVSSSPGQSPGLFVVWLALPKTMTPAHGRGH